ncbi:MAG: hypothetical protein IPL26_15835 [Leptospiraceae bacterium]|nr:hypothetical protein [Leptospiraceae bacterium]
MKDHLTTIFQTILQMHTEGGFKNFATFISNDEKNYYVQITGEKEGDSIYAEAVSNQSLKSPNQLNTNQINLLLRMGWLEPKGGEGNFYRTWSIAWDEDRKVVAEFLLQTLREVYGLFEGDELIVEIALE